MSSNYKGESPRFDKLLIFDLDETLIHTYPEQLGRPADIMFASLHVYRRPYARKMLRQLGEYFDMAVWSAGSEDYVEAIVRQVFPAPGKLRFIWGRSRCRMKWDPETGVGFAVKDLKKVKRLGYPLEKILIIEDTPANVAKNYGNAIYVRQYDGSRKDDEMRRLVAYLISIKDVADVRKVDKRGWRNHGH